jgi:hypothetical protein
MWLSRRDCKIDGQTGWQRRLVFDMFYWVVEFKKYSV